VGPGFGASRADPAAIMLRINAWDRLLKSKHDGELLIPILVMKTADRCSAARSTGTEKTKANFDAAQARRIVIVSSPPICKQGCRNYPCRCGSGKKDPDG
jgi:hypothetical protein